MGLVGACLPEQRACLLTLFYLLFVPHGRQECDLEDHLWMCLVCGFVGCGRYHEGHAREHWEKTEHCYCLELKTQRVWDYVGTPGFCCFTQGHVGGLSIFTAITRYARPPTREWLKLAPTSRGRSQKRELGLPRLSRQKW